MTTICKIYVLLDAASLVFERIKAIILNLCSPFYGPRERRRSAEKWFNGISIVFFLTIFINKLTSFNTQRVYSLAGEALLLVFVSGLLLVLLVWYAYFLVKSQDWSDTDLKSKRSFVLSSVARFALIVIFIFSCLSSGAQWPQLQVDSFLDYVFLCVLLVSAVAIVEIPYLLRWMTRHAPLLISRSDRPQW